MIPLPAFSTAIAVLAGLAGFTAGYVFEHRARLAEVAQIRAYFAQREAAAAIDTSRRIEAASRAADAAIAQRDARIQALDATNRRIRDELKTATTGRPCLSPAARGMLQQSPAFRLGLSAPTGSPLAAPAAPTAYSLLPSPSGRGAGGEGNIPSPSGRGAGGEGDTTDADLAGWILDAAGLYEACRARIDALRQWDEVTHDR
jgi:cell division protein FtsB